MMTPEKEQVLTSEVAEILAPYCKEQGCHVRANEYCHKCLALFALGAKHGAKQKAEECVGFAHELILSVLHPGTPDHMTRKEAAQLLRILMGKMQRPERPWPCDEAEHGS